MVTSLLVILRSWHGFGSTLSPFGWPRAHHPSNAGQRRWREDRRDSGLRAEPEWTKELCESAKRETSCLTTVSSETDNGNL